MDPYSFLDDNIKEYKDCLQLIEQVEKEINDATGKYKTNERLFSHIRVGSKERFLKLQEQEDLRFLMRELKVKKSLLHQRSDVLRAYPKFRAFITAAKRRLSADDWNGAWEEVENIISGIK